MNRPTTLTEMAKAAWHWLVPACCPLCQARREPEAPLCQACLSSLTRGTESRCPRCALPYPGDAGRHLCGDCSSAPPPFAGTCALGPYEGLLRDAIGRLKYSRLPFLDRPLGQLLGEAVTHQWPGYRPDLVTPVPLHPQRLRSRTFNQSLLLARRVASTLQAPLAPSALLRTRATPPQQGLQAAERRRNLRRAIAAGMSLEGKSVLLIDDVMTTATTARVCAAQLAAAGAVEIRVAVLARAPRYLVQ